MLRPALLKSGDGIGIIAPSGVVSSDRLQPAIDYLKKLGYRVKLGESVYKKNRYLAGHDSDRLNDLHTMFSDPEISAIFVARGGYGSTRLLKNVDYQLLKNNPKIFSGFSDTTALQLAIYSKINLVTFSGITLCADCTQDGFSELTHNYFWDLCCHGNFNQVENLNIIKPGVANGTLIAGCLSIITSLIGTEYMPILDQAILVIEDVNEEPYRIDRMLTQMRLSGIFDKIRGLVFGHFNNCTPESKSHGDLEPLYREVAEYVNGPVLSGLEYGHDTNRVVLPIGAAARLFAKEKNGMLTIANL